MALWRATAKACALYAAIYKYSATFLTESNEIIKMQYFIVFAGFFAMSALLMATFYWLPKGQAAHDKFIFKCGVNFTAILRGNSKWKHVIYWGVPVLVLLFSNFLGGLAMLAAAIIGLTFNRRYLASATPAASELGRVEVAASKNSPDTAP